MQFDVLIVGGGPAGLSAALILGRARRRILLCDEGKGRNRFARHMHGYLTRDGISPARFRMLGLAELRRYGVEVREMVVKRVQAMSARRRGRRVTGSGFVAQLAQGGKVKARKILLATGVVDELPEIPGLLDWYGHGVFHCPYCDGWEVRDRPVVAYGPGKAGVGLGLALRTWTEDVLVCTDGVGLSRQQQDRLERSGIRWRKDRVERLEGRRGRFGAVIFQEGEPARCGAFFFNTGKTQCSELAWQLGCSKNKNGGVAIDRRGRTGIPGLFLAGDASHEVDFVITAAADGARAAVAINRELQDEDRGEHKGV